MTLRFRTLLILALAGSLAACGFQLRGQAPLPFASAYVDAGQGGLADRLRRQLDARQKLAPAREGAEIVVRLGQFHELGLQSGVAGRQVLKGLASFLTGQSQGAGEAAEDLSV